VAKHIFLNGFISLWDKETGNEADAVDYPLTSLDDSEEMEIVDTWDLASVESSGMPDPYGKKTVTLEFWADDTKPKIKTGVKYGVNIVFDGEIYLENKTILFNSITASFVYGAATKYAATGEILGVNVAS
jgi:hypothetical protein